MGEEKKTSEAKLKANQRYLSKWEQQTVRFAPGTKKRIKDLGYSSVTAFIVAAIMEKMDREEGYRGKKG